MVACADNCKECLTATDRKCDLDMCDDFYGYNPLTETCNGKYIYSMCSLAVSTQDSPAVEPRSNPGSGKILMSENLRLYTTSPVVMC